MISKRIISEIRSLHLDKNRKEQQLFIAEGEKVVSELLNSDLQVKLIAGTEKFRASINAEWQQIEYIEISETELLKISLLRSPNNVLAVAKIPFSLPVDFKRESQSMLFLDGIKDPGNMGTLIRTADWFGIRHIMCSIDCVNVYNPKVVQSAMGSLFRVQLNYGLLSTFISEAKSTGIYQVVGASADGVPYEQCHTTKPVILVIGSESHGLTEEVLSLLDIKSAIQKSSGSKAESLNAGIAGGILMAHFQGGYK